MAIDKIKYIDEYNKSTYKMYQFRVRKDDKKLIEFLDNLDNRTNYILNLIKKDISGENTNKEKNSVNSTIQDLIYPSLNRHGINDIKIDMEKDCINISCNKGDIYNLMKKADLEEELSDLTNTIVNIKLIDSEEDY